MQYDKKAFMAGIAVGRQLKGWATSLDGGGGGIKPTGTKVISENGAYDITHFAYADVQVASPELSFLTNKDFSGAATGTTWVNSLNTTPPTQGALTVPDWYINQGRVTKLDAGIQLLAYFSSSPGYYMQVIDHLNLLPYEGRYLRMSVIINDKAVQLVSKLVDAHTSTKGLVIEDSYYDPTGAFGLRLFRYNGAYQYISYTIDVYPGAELVVTFADLTLVN